MPGTETLAHLGGYSTVALVLATFDNAGLTAWFVILPLVGATIYAVARAGYLHIVSATTAATTPATTPATDGGADVEADGPREVRA